MTPLSNKVGLTISQLTFGLRGIEILREPPTRGYAVVAGPYFEAEMPLLKAALDQLRGARPAIAEEAGGVTIYRQF